MNLLPLACCLVAFLALWRGLCWWMFSYDQARKAGLIAESSMPKSSIDKGQCLNGGGPMHTRPTLQRWLAALQQCPTCKRMCNVEHVGFEEFADTNKAVALLYCQSCESGYELLYVWDGSKWARDFCVKHGSHKPEEFARFKARVEEATYILA